MPGRWLFLWRREHRNELQSVNLLEVIPVRIAEWEEREDRVVLTRPKPPCSGIRGLIDRLLYLLSARRIRLDSVGSFAWLQLDGEHTVGQVALSLREEFGSDAEPAEERLGYLVRVFRREGLVGYRGWDDDSIDSC